jgi:glycosyltransferase involved in cell wall biosynthesis
MSVHIAHVLSYLSARYGGPPNCAKGYGKAMVRLGLEVSYWATGDRSDYEELTWLGDAVHLFDASRPRRWYHSPPLVRQLELMVGSIDLIHLHEVWTHPLYASAKIARKHGKPYLVTPHGIFTQRWRYRTLKKVLYRALFAGPMISGSACMHALTDFEVEGLRAAGYTGTITVIPSGVDAEEFSNLPEPEETEEHWPALRGKRVVLFLARLSPEKGLDVLIPAWSEVVKSRSWSDCVLVIAGPDERGYGSVVKRLIESHGVANRVLLTGMVQGREKLSLISRADVYTLPSRSEGFSVSVLENLAAGKPALITVGCNFPEVCLVGAGLCVPPEKSAIADGLRKLLDMASKERIAMGNRGKQLILGNYTWESVARKLISVYKCILTGQAIPLYPEPIPVDSSGKPVV